MSVFGGPGASDTYMYIYRYVYRLNINAENKKTVSMRSGWRSRLTKPFAGLQRDLPRRSAPGAQDVKMGVEPARQKR